MPSSTRDKWFLVQWECGSRDVIHINSVISPANEARVGYVVVTDRGNGSQETANIIAASRDRDLLEHHVSPKPEAVDVHECAVAGPSHKEEAKDFSDSASSWAPSDDCDDSTENDDEQAEEKNIKLEKYNDSYTKRTSRKILKPCHNADAINLSISKKSRKCTEDTKREEKARNVPNNKSQPDSTKNNRTPKPKTQSNIISAQVQEIAEITQLFNELFELIRDFKLQLALTERKVLNNIVNTPKEPIVKPEIKNTFCKDNVHDESKDVSDRDDDLNRSDDNMLITNKYTIANNKTLPLKDIKQNKKPTKKVKICANAHTDTIAVKDSNKKEKPGQWIPIGSGMTRIHKDQYKKVNWKSYTIATRTLLLALFPRRVLATHSLTGKKSPAFQEKAAKMCLDPKKVSDVIMEITDRFKIKENLVRSIITTKCADECKMYKMRQKLGEGKRKTLPANQENADFDEFEANKTF